VREEWWGGGRECIKDLESRHPLAGLQNLPDRFAHPPRTLQGLLEIKDTYLPRDLQKG
jgi:hypothetical protein